MKELLKRFLRIFPVLLFFSCTVSAPVVRESNWSITVIKDLEKEIVYETLSIFLNCYDDDGENDIETVFLIDDESGIFWELNSDTWDVKFINDVKWIGSKTLVMPNRGDIPRNPIRIHVRDLAGETVEDKLYISKRKIDAETLKFPELKIENDNFSLKNYENGQIYIYSGTTIISKKEITNEPKNFRDIFEKGRDKYDEDISFYVTVVDVDLTLKSGPWY